MVTKQDVLALMDETEAVYLATVGDKGPRIRALENLRRADLYPAASRHCRAAGFTVYLATSAASDKVREIRANVAVALYYCVPANHKGAMLSGRADVLDDPELKRSLWSEGWSAFWKGAGDPDYVVVRVAAEEVSGWWSGAPFRLEPDAR